VGSAVKQLTKSKSGRDLRTLGDHHRVVPLNPTLSPFGQGRPARGDALVYRSGTGARRPLLPTGEKVPEGPMTRRDRPIAEPKLTAELLVASLTEDRIP